MEYPRDFSAQARARVEADRLKAGKELEQRRSQVPWSQFGPSAADREHHRKYILRVFLVFAQELCKLGSQRQWTVDRIRSVAYEFLRSFTIEAYYDKGHDKQGRKLREMVSNWNGSILPEVQREFEKSAEWQQFEQELLAVAEQQARGSPQSSGKVEAQKLERAQVREETPGAHPVAGNQKEQRRERTQSHRRTLKEKLANPNSHDTATVKEIRDYVGLSKSKAYRLIDEGQLKKLPQPKKGSKVLVLVTSIADYLKESSE